MTKPGPLLLGWKRVHRGHHIKTILPFICGQVSLAILVFLEDPFIASTVLQGAGGSLHAWQEYPPRQPHSQNLTKVSLSSLGWPCQCVVLEGHLSLSGALCTQGWASCGQNILRY